MIRLKKLLSEQREIDAVKGIIQNQKPRELYKLVKNAMIKSGDLVVFNTKYFQSKPNGVIENIAGGFSNMKINGVSNATAISKFQSNPQKYLGAVELTDEQILDVVENFKFNFKDFQRYRKQFFPFQFEIPGMGRAMGQALGKLTGKFNYTYADEDIKVTPAEGNNDTTCTERECIFWLPGNDPTILRVD